MSSYRLFLVFSALVLVSGCQRSSSQPQPDAVHVLFVGNSYIYYNNLPGMLEGIAASKGAVSLSARHHTHGGHMLYEHLEDGHLLDYLDPDGLESKAWDFVVLQEQSTLGARIQQARQGLLGDPEDEFATGVAGLHQLVQDA